MAFSLNKDEYQGKNMPSLEGIYKSAPNAQDEIPIKDLESFPDHPYSVCEDEAMNELVESIKQNGVLEPVTVRTKNAGTYEIISGHRRCKAAELAGLTKVPAVVKEMSDEDAVIAMVDSNLHRPDIPLSEKGFAYKMKLKALRKKSKGGRTDEELAASESVSASTIQRLIKITELLPSLLAMVDEKNIAFMAGVTLADLNRDEQRQLAQFLAANELKKISPAQADKIVELADNGDFTDLNLYEIFNPPKDEGKWGLKEKDVDEYFPDGFSGKQKEEAIKTAILFYITQHGGDYRDASIWEE